MTVLDCWSSFCVTTIIKGVDRSNVNKRELVYGESSSNARDASDVCLSFVLLFTIFIIVVTQLQVLQQSKNVTAKCTETQSPPPSIQFSLEVSIYVFYYMSDFSCTPHAWTKPNTVGPCRDRNLRHLKMRQHNTSLPFLCGRDDILRIHKAELRSS